MNNEEKGFSYTYCAKQQAEIENIRKKYLPAEEDKMEQLRKLDRSATHAGSFVSLCVGVIGTLVMGIGMCCCLVWSYKWFVQGIVIGVVGIAMIISAYPLYVEVVKRKQRQIAPEILRLSEELRDKC